MAWDKMYLLLAGCMTIFKGSRFFVNKPFYLADVHPRNLSQIFEDNAPRDSKEWLPDIRRNRFQIFEEISPKVLEVTSCRDSKESRDSKKSPRESKESSRDTKESPRD